MGSFLVIRNESATGVEKEKAAMLYKTLNMYRVLLHVPFFKAGLSRNKRWQ